MAVFKAKVNSNTKRVKKVDANSHVRYVILSRPVYWHTSMEVWEERTKTKRYVPSCWHQQR